MIGFGVIQAAASSDVAAFFHKTLEKNYHFA
jgi:hypothetical protein